ANNDVTKFMTADVRDPEAVLAAPEVKDLLDFSRPAVIMLVGMLHYLSPDVVDEVVAAYRDVLAPGSHLFMTSLVDTGLPQQQELARITRENLEAGWAIGRASGSEIVLISLDVESIERWCYAYSEV